MLARYSLLGFNNSTNYLGYEWFVFGRWNLDLIKCKNPDFNSAHLKRELTDLPKSAWICVPILIFWVGFHVWQENTKFEQGWFAGANYLYCLFLWVCTQIICQNIYIADQTMKFYEYYSSCWKYNKNTSLCLNFVRDWIAKSPYREYLPVESIYFMNSYLIKDTWVYNKRYKWRKVSGSVRKDKGRILNIRLEIGGGMIKVKGSKVKG